METPELPASWTWACIAVGIPSLAWLAWRQRKGAGAAPKGAAAPEPWGILWAGAGLFLYLGTAVAIALVLFATGKLDIQDASSIPLDTQLALDAAAKVVALGSVLLLHSAISRARGAPKGAPAPAGASARAGALAALAFLPVMFGITWLQQRGYEAAGWRFEIQDVVKQVFTEDEGTLAFFAVFAVVLAPLFEEVFFRGFLYGGLRRWLGPGGAAVLSAAIFAGYHLEVDAFPALLVLGVVLAWLRERTGGLVAPIAMHACYNAVQVVGIAMARGG